MAVYLDEEMVGRDVVVGFPHLLVCMGLVALVEKDGQRDLIGVHLTDAVKTARIMAVFASHMFGPSFQGKIVALYGSCNRSVRYPGSSNLEASWKKEMAEIAGFLGYKGVARGFDTGVIGPRDGTYVQYDVNLLNGFPVRIFYKQDDRMKYGTTGGGQNEHIRYASETEVTPEMQRNPKLVAHYAKLAKDGIDRVDAKASAAVAKPGLFKTSKLHEVDYSVRLTEVFVAPDN